MTYLEKYKLEHHEMFEDSGLIYTHCPGDYFNGGPVMPEEDKDNPEGCTMHKLGCRACWNQEFTVLDHGRRITDE